uniref:ZMYM2-like/QRICH1 C-terminal domain-containing protein n=1 Tax=Amphimedon queenslandica TaxID=400682 RepID=A0A1X7V1V6_AMPQE
MVRKIILKRCIRVHLDNKVVHHANSSIGNRCLVFLVELYISKLPESAFEKELFYCRPVPVKHIKDDNPWYYDTPVGNNILKTKFKVMFEAAGQDAGGISNHSLRATGVTRMFDKGVPEKIIMERSGHLSISGVCSYERTTCLQQKQVSDVLTSSSTYDPVEVKDESNGSGGKENMSDVTDVPVSDQVGDVMKSFNFESVKGCTFNFNFYK